MLGPRLGDGSRLLVGTLASKAERTSDIIARADEMIGFVVA